MLTAKGKYSLKALIHLSRLKPGQKGQASEIARTANIPKKFLDAILGELRNAGFVYAKKGPGGGYMLASAATDIKVGHLIRVIDGPLAPIACASRTQYAPCQDCRSVKTCGVRLAMSKVREAISDVLDGMSIADMVAVSEEANVTSIFVGTRSSRSNRKRR
jgi:Rrf2 family protein